MKIRFFDADAEAQLYVPDFHVRFSGGRFLGRRVRRPWIVETKYSRDVTDNWEGIRPKVRAGVGEASKLHSVFHIVTECHLKLPRSQMPSFSAGSLTRISLKRSWNGF